MKIFTRSRRDLAAISARIAARSRRDRGAFLAAEIPPSRRDHGRDRGEITARYGKSRRPKTRRDSRRDAGNLGGQKRAAISPRFSPRSQRDMEISAGKYAARCCSEIVARYGNLGGQNAPWSRGDIAARYGYVGGQFRGEASVGVLPGFAARNKIPCGQNLTVIPSRSETSAAKLGSMRTIFTFTLTINQTTRRWQNYVLYCSSRNC